jgi:hypothetical protein
MRRPRLSTLLPSLNVAVAATLLCWGFTRPLQEWSPVPWEMSLCFSINAPANLLRLLISFLWDKHIQSNCSVASSKTCMSVGQVVEIGMFLVAVGVVWYVVGLEIEYGGQRKRAIVPSSTWLRAGADVFLISGGGLFAFIFVANLRELHLVFAPWPFIGVCCFLMWALALAIPYGHHLVRCIAEGRAA